MKEIKSFREYIAERAILNELTDQEYNDKYSSSASNVASNASSDASSEPQSAPSQSSSFKLTTDANLDKLPLEVSDIDLKITSRTPQSRFDELDTKATWVRNTYNVLDKYITAPNVKKVRTSDVSTPIADITNENSFGKILNFWEDKFGKVAESQQEIRKGQYWLKILRSSKSTDEQKEQARKELAKIAPEYTTPAEEQPKKENNSENSEEKKPEPARIFEAWHPFKTSGEISSGVGNKWNTRRVLSTINRSKSAKEEDEVGKLGIFGQIDFDKMLKKYQSDAKEIIAKEKKIGLSYLEKAEKDINKYKIKLKYLKVHDNDFLNTISINIARSMSVLTSIGRGLQNLMVEFNNSLRKVYNERVDQTAENKEKASGLNATIAMKRYDNAKAETAERNEKLRQATEIVNQRNAERLKVQQGREQEAKDAKNAAIAFKEETFDRVYNEIKKAYKDTKTNKSRFFTYTDLVNYISRLPESPNGTTVKFVDENDDEQEVKFDGTKVSEILALTGKILYELIKNDAIKEIRQSSDSAAKQSIKSEFDKVYDDALSDTERKMPGAINDDIKKAASIAITNPPKKDEPENSKKKKAFKSVSVNPEEVARKKAEREKKKEERRESFRSKVDKAKNAGKTAVGKVKKVAGDVIDQYGRAGNSAAKDFEGEEPENPETVKQQEEPTDGMNIVQYAAYKANKLNKKGK